MNGTMNAYYVDVVWRVSVIISVMLGNSAKSSSPGSTHLLGVVNSSITLRCLIPPDFDTEIVSWSVNSSAIPFLTYFVEYNAISPSNHDPRFSIMVPELLDISHLMKSDSGIYECRLTSSLQVNYLVSTINVTVKDGCTMLPYNSPLSTTSNVCLPGEVLPYAQHCHFTCDEGFQLVGNDSMECLSNGELSSQTPHCEEITCRIGDLHPHLKDNNGTCMKDAQVSYGVTCHFECTTGYSLTVNGTIKITCDREQGGVPYFPECKVISEESSGLPVGYIALICILILLIIVALGILLWVLRRSHKDEKGKTDDPEEKEIIPLIPSCRSFMEYLRQQIGESYTTMGKILQKLEKVELKNIPKLDMMTFRENEAQGMRSITDAFVWYVAEILRCIGKSNKSVADNLITDIISCTEDRASVSASAVSTVVESIASQETEDDAGTKTYFEVVHCAFQNLLVVMQNSINDQKVVREMTTNVSIMMEAYFAGNKQGQRDTAAPSPIYKSISSNWAESSDGASFFAKICLQNIDKCENSTERIHMRFNIIRTMIDLAAPADGSDK